MKVLELGFNFNIMISTQLSHKALVLAPEMCMHISLMNTDETVLNCTEYASGMIFFIEGRRMY